MSSENEEEWHTVSKKTKKKSKEKTTTEICSVKLIPYLKHNNKLCILLGLDSQFKELTPLGGTCLDRIACNKIPADKLKACLSRELDEESKSLLDLDNILDFEKCKVMSTSNELEWGEIHHRTYFAELNLSDTEERNLEALHTLLNTFQDPTFNKALEQKLIHQNKNRKNYFEMSQLVLVTLDDDHFYNMIHATIQHVQLFKEEAMKLDRKLSSSIDNILKRFFKEHPFDVKKYNPSITRLDPRLLCWIIQSLQLTNDKIYKSINDLIDDFISYLKSGSTCHYKVHSKTKSQEVSVEEHKNDSNSKSPKSLKWVKKHGDKN